MFVMSRTARSALLPDGEDRTNSEVSLSHEATWRH